MQIAVTGAASCILTTILTDCNDLKFQPLIFCAGAAGTSIPGIFSQGISHQERIRRISYFGISVFSFFSLAYILDVRPSYRCNPDKLIFTAFAVGLVTRVILGLAKGTGQSASTDSSQPSEERSLVAVGEDSQGATSGPFGAIWDLGKSALPSSLVTTITEAHTTKEVRREIIGETKWTSKKLTTEDGSVYEHKFYRWRSIFGCCSHTKKETWYGRGESSDFQETARAEEVDE